MASKFTIANTPTHRSLFDFPTLWHEKLGFRNILHLSLYKSKHMKRLVLRVEVLASADGFEHVYMLRLDLQRITGRDLLLSILKGFNSLFKTIVKSTITTEKCPMTDHAAAREPYGKQKTNDVRWIRSEGSPTRVIKNPSFCPALERLLGTCPVDLFLQQWMIRMQIRRNESIRPRLLVTERPRVSRRSM